MILLAPPLLALLGGGVDVSLEPSGQTAPAGCLAAVDIVLSASSPQQVAAVDVLLSWDPTELALVQAIPSDADWFVAAFLNDPDGINDDVTDGEALFTALANPASPLDVPPTTVVATVFFEVLTGGDVALLPTAGVFGATEVVGTTPGVPITGTLGAPVSITVMGVPSLEVKRFGTPPNPDALQPGLTSGPVIGATWDPYVDHTTFFPGALVDVIGVTALPSIIDIPSPFGTFLCDIFGPVRIYARPAGVPFSLPVPFDCSLIGGMACTQAASTDGFSTVLTNALDVTVGTF